MESSTSISIISCRHSSSSESPSQLPLVSGPSSSSPSSSSFSNEEVMEDTFGVGSLSIVGTGMNVQSTHFVAGTGPLFDFGVCGENGLCGVVGCSVSLSASSLTNTTSTRLSSRFSPSCSFLTQRLIGTSISHSTNHLSGTSGTELNWAGSTLLSNSSFSSCVTNDAPSPITEPPTPSPTSSVKFLSGPQSAQFEILYGNPTGNQVWIESCTFSGLSALFGGAVYIAQTSTAVYLKDTTFRQCTADGGGAILVMFNSPILDTKRSVTLFNCQFYNNTADTNGGHFSSQYTHPNTIAQCTFEDSRSDATPFTQQTPLQIDTAGGVRFDNTTFSANEGSTTGCVIVTRRSNEVSTVLTNLLFLENMSCSTKIEEQCLGPSILSLTTEVKISADEEGFDVELTLEGMFTGTSRKYDVTIEASNGKQFVTEGVSFSSTTSSTLPFRLNRAEGESLSFGTTYKIVEVKKSVSQSARNGFDLDDAEPDWTWWHHMPNVSSDAMVELSFKTPVRPALTQIKADLNTANLNEAIVMLTVDKIWSGDFSLVVTLVGGPSTEITITNILFSTSATPTSSTVSVAVHPSGTLKYGKTYKVKSLSCSGIIVSHSSPTFKVPDAPPRLTSATSTLTGTHKTEVTVLMNGESLPCGKDFTIVVKEMDGTDVKADAAKLSLIGTIGGSYGNTTTCSASVEIYNQSSTLEYSKRYKIVSLEIVGLSCVVDSTVNFTVDDSPGRVEGAETRSVTEGRTEVIVIVNGVNFPSSGSLAMTVKRGSSTIDSKSVQRDSSSQLTVVFDVAESESVTSLAFGADYVVSEVVSEVVGGEVFVNGGVGFSVPSLLKSADAALSLSVLGDVVLTVSAFGFPSSTAFVLTCVRVDGDDNQDGTPFDLASETSETTGATTHTLTATACAMTITFGKRFEITKCEVDNHKTVLDGRILFSVPNLPSLSSANFSFASFANTTVHLALEGSDLPVGETFLVSLDGCEKPIEIEFNSRTHGSSSEEAIGWPDTVKFDTSYPVVSVLRKSSPIFSIPCTGLVLSTGSQPDPLSVFANDSSHQNPKLCGNSARPCSSVDVAWMIVNAYSVQTVVLKIVTKVSLSSSIVIESGQVASFEKHAVSPTLVIPSTASHEDSPGLVSVAGTLTIDKVSIVVQTGDLAFVLFDVNGGGLVLDSVHISGVPSSSDLVDDADELCSWETGLIKLHDATMSTHSCEFSSIGMGEIWMESSNLSLKSTQILSNGPRFTRFPSAQQDVMCKSGNITILPSASDMIDDHWISSLMECSVLLNGSELKSPHFVPSLDVKNSTSTQSKQKDSFSVVLVGSKLIPCGLSLEVSESSSSQSSKANSGPVQIPLSFSSDDSWNETHITLSIPSSSLSSLSSNEKWDACLVYGHDLRTSSFTFLPSLRDRKALTLQKTLPWLIPVIVCSVVVLLAIIFVVLVVLWRRKKNAASKGSSQLLNEKEMDFADEVAKVDVEVAAGSTMDEIRHPEESPLRHANVTNPSPPTDCDVDREGNGRPFVASSVEAMQCEGAFGIVSVDAHDMEKRQGENSTTLNQGERSLSQTTGKGGIEEIRWRAPEQGEKEGEMNESVDGSKVMVFRLGLILYEIETGVVPFGEIDAVSAHRNLAAGIALPLQRVTNPTTRELIEGCLHLQPDLRLSLQQILTKLGEEQTCPDKMELHDPFALF
ncbi:hypothetical protein BLNAU_14082 [Blattamonas nauphoetae]|uniref:Serine-threonine/tyrosine-protein kinase catalytic domain-containing protein n=1 Tax=Blattamonas nauphoetae TaxID=2049346 RepID=A0ABQ9XH34_9EUKA|nr:hypothetical protein BLNAU_14082 [Blattamonas nauphoetae]